MVQFLETKERQFTWFSFFILQDPPKTGPTRAEMGRVSPLKPRILEVKTQLCLTKVAYPYLGF